MGWGGIGTLIGKLSDYIPGAKERRRNKIEKLKREYDKIRALPCTPDNAKRLSRIAYELSVLQRQAENS